MRGYVILLLFIPAAGLSQSINDSISKEFIKNTITYLQDDAFGGRVNYTQKQLRAAEYLSNQFSSFGLDPYPLGSNYFIPFHTTTYNEGKGEELYWNGNKVEDSLFIFFSHQILPTTVQQDDFVELLAMLPIADSLLLLNWNVIHRNLLIRIILPEGMSFSEAIKNLLIPVGLPGSDILLVAANEKPVHFKYTWNKKNLYSVLYNIVGMLPGQSLPNEAIIFSANYDAWGSRQGANNNGSGTTAVLALAKYFAMRNDNKRTLIFCLFAGKELGLLGSYSFANFIKSKNVKAVINIAMIGAAYKSDSTTFLISHSTYSDLKRILSKNLLGSTIKIQKNTLLDSRTWIERSDDYPFFLQGIPAHSIMGTAFRSPCNYDSCDDMNNIDIEYMTKIIRGIAKSCSSLISGKDTPRRIKR